MQLGRDVNISSWVFWALFPAWNNLHAKGAHLGEARGGQASLGHTRTSVSVCTDMLPQTLWTLLVVAIRAGSGVWQIGVSRSRCWGGIWGHDVSRSVSMTEMSGRWDQTEGKVGQRCQPNKATADFTGRSGTYPSEYLSHSRLTRLGLYTFLSFNHGMWTVPGRAWPHNLEWRQTLSGCLLVSEHAWRQVLPRMVIWIVHSVSTTLGGEPAT